MTNTYGDNRKWGLNWFGFVNQIKMIPNSNPPVYTVGITIQQGPRNNSRPVFYDLNIEGLSTFMLLSQYQNQINNKDTTVLARFNCYNTYPKPFIYKEGDNIVYENGEPKLGVTMRGYLSSISYLKVGEHVAYHRGSTPSAENRSSVVDSQNEYVPTSKQVNGERGTTMDSFNEWETVSVSELKPDTESVNSEALADASENGSANEETTTESANNSVVSLNEGSISRRSGKRSKRALGA